MVVTACLFSAFVVAIAALGVIPFEMALFLLFVCSFLFLENRRIFEDKKWDR